MGSPTCKQIYFKVYSQAHSVNGKAWPGTNTAKVFFLCECPSWGFPEQAVAFSTQGDTPKTLDYSLDFCVTVSGMGLIKFFPAPV